MIYTVTFNPALDYVIRMESLKLGTVNRSSAEAVYYGGKGINVSTVLKNIGVDSVALGFVAGFTGKEIEEGVKNMGIATDFIKLPEGMSRINVKIKAEQETEINGQGPAISMEKVEKLFEKLDRLEKGDCLVLAGTIPASLPSDIYEQIMDRLKDKEIRIVVDATKDLLLNVLKYHPFLIKPNNHELGEMFGVVLKTDEEIVEACKLAQADEFIQLMPNKYDTYIEQGGTNVSGGQRQRLCIARAILKSPKILILDDSTSAVDTKTDALIRQAFLEKIPHTTRIIISQRVSSIQDADQILVIDDGKVSDLGTHEELLKSNAMYKETYEAQNNGGDFDEQ